MFCRNAAADQLYAMVGGKIEVVRDAMLGQKMPKRNGENNQLPIPEIRLAWPVDRVALALTDAKGAITG